MLRRLGLWLAGLEEVPDQVAYDKLQGYLVVTEAYTGTRVVGRTRGDGANDIREIIRDKNEWMLVRRRT